MRNLQISHNHEEGFTLIEALVALMIAATALVVVMGRLGVSSDTQLTLTMHELALEQAQNRMVALSIQPPQMKEQQGDYELNGTPVHWRSWSEKTELDRFIRQNVAVKVDAEPEVNIFLYRAVP